MNISYDYVMSESLKVESKKFAQKKHLSDKQLSCKCYDNATILPLKEDYREEKNGKWGKGGVVDSQGNFVQESAYTGDWVSQGGLYEYSTVVSKMDKEVVYIGCISSHYGHFLVDCTTKLWALLKLKKDITVAYTGDRKISGNEKRIIELLGVKNENLLHVDKPMSFKKVFVPEQGAKPGVWYTKEYAAVFKLIQENIDNSVAHFDDFNRKVYFTRTGYSDAKKKEVGESTLEKVFFNNGFEIHHPEKMDLIKMMELVNAASVVVCINGTIPLNMIFSSNKNLKLVVLNKTDVYHRNLEYFVEICNLNIEYVDVYNKFKGNDLGLGPFFVTVTDELKRYLFSNNMTLPNNFNSIKYKDYFIFILLKINRLIRNKLRPIKVRFKEFLSNTK